MMIGVTGSDGFLGWHTRVWLRTHRPDIQVSLATREMFGKEGALESFVADLDAIVHLAGVNRAPDIEIEFKNPELAANLVSACMRNRSLYKPPPHLIYANSTRFVQDTPYGRGKLAAKETLELGARELGAKFTNLILPHVFGEFGRPFYNSAALTFCHQLATGVESTITTDGAVELIHAQTIAEAAITAIETGTTGDQRFVGESMKVSELLETLRPMALRYFSEGTMPGFSTQFERRLFNTLRSFKYPKLETWLPPRKDQRGHLVEAMKADAGGQIFYSVTHPGVTRGNHYHTQKFERFLVCEGEAEIRIRKLFSDEVVQFRVSGTKPCAIDMPTFCTHSITNIGDHDLITLFWSDEIFDPDSPDTYPEDVIR